MTPAEELKRAWEERLEEFRAVDSLVAEIQARMPQTELAGPPTARLDVEFYPKYSEWQSCKGWDETHCTALRPYTSDPWCCADFAPSVGLNGYSQLRSPRHPPVAGWTFADTAPYLVSLAILLAVCAFVRSLNRQFRTALDLGPGEVDPRRLQRSAYR